MSAAIPNDQFLSQLRELFVSHKDSNSLFLGVKRFTAVDAENSGLNTTGPCPMLFRASTNKARAHKGTPPRVKKVKFSTIVEPEKLEQFYASYAEALRVSVSGLRKKDKKKKQKK